MPKLIARWNSARDVWETLTTGLFCEHSDVFLETWPTSGMTRAGTAYGLPTWVPRMAGSASSSLLPTPTVSEANGPGLHGDGGQDLRTTVSLLPTPTHRDFKAPGDPAKLPGRMADRAQPLTEIITLLPTPAVNDMGAGKTVEHWDEWTAAMQAKHGNGNGHGKSLAIEAQRLLPTPRARDAQPEGQAAGERRMELYATGTLSTVLALLPTGASTPPPSLAGNTPSDAERLPLPSQDPKVDEG